MATVIENDTKQGERNEVAEDIHLSKAIAEGEETPRVSRDLVFEVLQPKISLRNS